MVYCGKPSTACDRCRPRRLKCDRSTPSCSQCMRARVPCPGYRDTLDLNFRDQSDDVIRKAKQQSHRRSVVTAKSNQQVVRSAPLLSFGLRPPPDELAKGYFFTNFGGCHMPYLLMKSKHSLECSINAGLTAVGLAALSNLHMSPRLMLAARRHYATALSQTNHALGDASSFRKDETLAGVALLSTFELVTCGDGSFIDRWAKHMDGAAKLIECRGTRQLKSAEGLHLFTVLRSQIVISRVYEGRYTSSILTHLTEEAQKYRSPNFQVLDQLGLAIIRVCNFCAAVRDGTITQPGEIIRSALGHNADLVSILLSVPDSWTYSTAELPEFKQERTMHAVWGDKFHLYRNLTVSTAWNNYRSARLILHELIISTVEACSSNIIDEQTREILLNQSQKTSRQIVQDICASVPYHFGTTAGETTPTMSGGITIVWPLLVTANSRFASPELREWVMSCLDRIGHYLGINQALASARLLRDGMETRSWVSSEYDRSSRAPSLWCVLNGGKSSWG
ncbi:hypothetical protein BO94DRAFT_473979 [Aspergillus sclerotioniger CBS 115572]|uniref:Zn(2)-C6 fungal-type domain-containing protein n=1 Tax=Aspergillus sclerotioniger CBS 115572 TaxID=1450535 RepID=A0A317VNX4_9EURO|nr:hypothetical protein BO94DRAFT_473979 [Aspergillus sclerotioniger CBS 115572]PWY76036.1 hypothetical protein BO94DRAFT_473979 [Aspergillus sclerotioniger CBS 115572]